MKILNTLRLNVSSDWSESARPVSDWLPPASVSEVVVETRPGFHVVRKVESLERASM